MHDYRSAFSLDGKVVLITGAARGLGAEAARACAQMGARVVVTDVLETPGQALVAELVAAGASARFERHDVTSEAEWERAVATAISAFGGLDVLVNNAGIETAALLTACAVEDFRRVLDVNVTGVFLGIKHAMRAMSPGGTAGRGGSIINLSSAAGFIGVTAHATYCAPKGAVRLLTKGAAVECAQLQTRNRVNSLHPAIIGTTMGQQFIRELVELGLAPDLGAATSGLLALHPMGRFGEPRDVAGAILYLAADVSTWVTGAELAIDGGLAAA